MPAAQTLAGNNKIRLAPGQGRVRSPIIISSILLFFISILYYLIYQVYPARARAPLGAPDAKVGYQIVGPMVASLLLGAFWRSWVATWRSSTRLCFMMRYLVSIFFVL